ncbi:MAG: AAA family ATPase, partial [Saprospiraceae bacterium]
MSDFTENSYSKYLKFKDLKIYSSTEWLSDNNKKYRQVFDKATTSYIYVEITFYNKYFDVEDWDLELELKCYSLKKGKKELCNLNFKRKVSKFDYISFIREGWGNKDEGSFWKKGTYFWELWIGGEKITTKYFYIEENPALEENISSEANGFFKISSVKLYEGPYDDVLQPEKTYLKKFDQEETRYIYVEIELENLNIQKNWNIELFIKFFNFAKELKGQVVRLQRVERNDKTITLSAGWGSNIKGSWRKDNYTVELVFMDKLIAVIPFEVGDFSEDGTPALYTSFIGSQISTEIQIEENDGKTFEELLLDLDKLIGLQNVKQKVREHAKYIKFLQLRKSKNIDSHTSININSVFVGNPGTGKTTVANMMGKIYKKMGVLSKGHVLVVDRADLVAEYIGQTAPKVKEVISKARGGILFIDEAYSLARANDDNKDFGREVIEILVKELSADNNDFAVMVAGYPKEMKHFLESNPGLKSRFKQHYEFADYLPQELISIADFAAKEKNVVFSAAAKTLISQIITSAFRNRDKMFGNARFVMDLIEQAKTQLGLRIMSNYPHPEQVEISELSLIQLEDVSNTQFYKNKQLPEIPVDQALLQDTLNELNSLIGMAKVKEQINELVRLVNFNRSINKDVLNAFSLHTVFVGSTGTGKTTVARILTKIYKALGLLERGHIVETDSQSLISSYIGQTSTKTTEKIDEANGGVLFIDEAYGLTSSSEIRSEFGSEAIQI